MTFNMTLNEVIMIMALILTKWNHVVYDFLYPINGAKLMMSFIVP